MGRATIFFAALLCLAAPIPAFTQHTNSGTCNVSYDDLGYAAYAVWIGAAILGGVSVVIDLIRGRLWSLVAVALCIIASVVAVVLLFVEAPLCGGFL